MLNQSAVNCSIYKQVGSVEVFYLDVLVYKSLHCTSCRGRLILHKVKNLGSFKFLLVLLTFGCFLSLISENLVSL